jgi:predicted Zn-dependent protease
VLVDPAVEIIAGQQIASDYEKKNTILPADHPLTVALSRVGRKIALQATDRTTLRFTFKVVDSKDINAFCLVGGHVYATTGLLNFISRNGAVDEDMIAAAIGHEVAHGALRHIITSAHQKGALNRIFGQNARKDIDELKAVISKGLSREMEMEADHYGALYAVRAGYRFGAMIELFDRMRTSFGDMASFEEVVKSEHPPFSERIKALQEYHGRLQKIIDFWESGMQSLHSGNLEDAELYFSIVAADFPRLPAVSHNLGVVSIRKYLAALPESELGEERIFVTYATSLGFTMRSAAEDSEPLIAETWFRKAIEADSHYAPAYEGLGICEMLKKNMRKAKSSLEEALNLDRGWASFHNSMGVLERRAGNHQSAAAYFERAVQLEPGFTPALFNYALTLQGLGRQQEAKAAWDRYLSIDRSGYWHNRAAKNRTTLAQASGEPFSYSNLAPRRFTEFGGIAIGSPLKKINELLGEPSQVRVGKGRGAHEEWVYVSKGLSFIVSNRCVAAIVIRSKEAGRLEGLGVGDNAKAVTETLGQPPAVEKEADGSEWWTYQPEGITFKIEGGAVQLMMIGSN